MGEVKEFKKKTADSRDVQLLINELSEAVLGKQQEIKLCTACLLARGHLLIEDMPGMGKTTLVKSLGKAMGLTVSRIQFTNDLLPSDIIGTNVYDTKTQSFRFLKGPIFGHIVLGDELNRATPKTQSAFLQAMEERKITVDGTTWELPSPFFLIATQNPEEQIGTFPLPESQIDRFMMKVSLGFPDKSSELQLLRRDNTTDISEGLSAILHPQLVTYLQQEVQKVFASDSITSYIQDILAASRGPQAMDKWISSGLSPRAGLLILSAGRAWAYMAGRDHMLPEDIQAVAPYVIHHRLQAEQNQNALSTLDQAKQFIKKVNVPL
jgi:MoxR-like ATPase